MTILCTVLCFGFLAAQETVMDQTKNNELGTSIQALLGSSGGGYGLTYRRHYKHGAFRFGMNISGADGESQRNQGAGTSNGSSNNNLNLDARIGLEGHIWFTPNWMLYLGGDVLVARSYNQSTSVFEEPTQDPRVLNTANRGTGIGLASVMGVRYQITPRVSLGTELRYVGRVFFTSNATISNDGIEQRNSSTTFSHFLERPNAIYLQVNF